MLNKPRYRNSYTPFDAIHPTISVTDGYGLTIVGKPRLGFWFRFVCLFKPDKLLDYIHVRDVLLVQAANSAAASIYDKGYMAGRKSMVGVEKYPVSFSKTRFSKDNPPRSAASSFTGSGPTSETREVYVDNTAANLAMASMLHNSGLHSTAAGMKEDSYKPISTQPETDCRASSYSSGSDSYESSSSSSDSSSSTDSGSYGD